MRTLRFALVAILVGFGAVGAVAAATAGATAGSNDPQMSPDEVVERSINSIDQMQETLRQGIDRLEQARTEKDLMRYNCINAKLKAIRGLVQIGELSGQALKEAVSQSNDELIHHNYTKIDLARARVEASRVEIEACVGEQSFSTGSGEKSVTIDADMRQDDPSEADVLAWEPIDIDRPTPATLSF